VVKINLDKGFSLLEIVVALGILTLLLLPISSFLTSGVHQLSTARSIAEATSLLQSAVEEVKLLAKEDWETIDWDEIKLIDPEYQIGITLSDGPDPDTTKWVTVEILNADGSSIAGGQVKTQIFIYRQ